MPSSVFHVRSLRGRPRNSPSAILRQSSFFDAILLSSCRSTVGRVFSRLCRSGFLYQSGQTIRPGTQPEEIVCIGLLQGLFLVSVKGLPAPVLLRQARGIAAAFNHGLAQRAQIGRAVQPDTRSAAWHIIEPAQVAQPVLGARSMGFMRQHHSFDPGERTGKIADHLTPVTVDGYQTVK